MNRLRTMLAQDGPWAIYQLWALAVNRLRLVLIRALLRVPDVYFQGTPRIVGRRHIAFGRDFRCGRGSWIEAVDIGASVRDAALRIVIGDHVSASENLHIGAVALVEIGDHVLIGSGVLITDHSHGEYHNGGAKPTTPPNDRAISCKGPVRIGRNVWIGDGAKILSGVTIGEGAVIGANTVVRRDVPSQAVFSSGHADAAVVRRYDESSQSWERVKGVR